MEIYKATLDRRKTLKLMGSACVVQALWSCQGGEVIEAENVSTPSNNEDPRPLMNMDAPAGVEAGMDAPAGVEAGMDMPAGVDAGMDMPAGVDIPEDVTTASFDLTDPVYNGLNDVGGTSYIDVGDHKIILIRINDDEILALNRICTHSSCDMRIGVSGQWDQLAQQLTCLCHNSIFDRDGQVISGPANSPLEVYDVTFDQNNNSGSITVDL